MSEYTAEIYAAIADDSDNLDPASLLRAIREETISTVDNTQHYLNHIRLAQPNIATANIGVPLATDDSFLRRLNFAPVRASSPVLSVIDSNASVFSRSPSPVVMNTTPQLPTSYSTASAYAAAMRKNLFSNDSDDDLPVVPPVVPDARWSDFSVAANPSPSYDVFNDFTTSIPTAIVHSPPRAIATDSVVTGPGIKPPVKLPSFNPSNPDNFHRGSVYGWAECVDTQIAIVYVDKQIGMLNTAKIFDRPYSVNELTRRTFLLPPGHYAIHVDPLGHVDAHTVEKNGNRLTVADTIAFWRTIAGSFM